MKYCAENDLSLFEFHDAAFSFFSFDGKDLVVSASMVNIHKDAPQNPYDFDMEIASAQITFRNFGAAAYEPGIAWRTGEDGKSYPVEPPIIFSGQEAIEQILEELKHKFDVFHFEKEEKHGYFIDGCGIEPYFMIKFDVDSVIICWDEYKKKAWYERHRQYRFDAVLHTPGGDESVKLTIGCHEDPVYIKGCLKQPPVVSVGCTYGAKKYWGYGGDHLWIDAFADLQRQLPEGVLLKCCQPQTDEFHAFNEFLHFLKKK